MYDLVVENARIYPMAADAGAAAATSFAVQAGRIAAVPADGPGQITVDAGGEAVLPGLIDCHTHALYAGNRMEEHHRRLAGTRYEDIARSGGGIMATVRAVRAASEDQLVEETLPRLAALRAEGVTTVEIKSGYGLDTETELKMLRAIARLRDHAGIDVVATFLGAHAVPPEQPRDRYLAEVIEAMLPAVAGESLAESVDVFIESIGFTADEADAIYSRARELGLAVRAHAEQLSCIGASATAARHGALSCDHLEYLDEAGARAMAAAGTTAVLLPGAFYFLRETRKPPLPLLRRHGVPVAVATDLNPGSSPLASLLTAMHLATVSFGLRTAEALLGVTREAARALGRGADRGTLEPGKRADFALWDVPSPEFLLYQLGGVRPSAVYVEGVRL